MIFKKESDILESKSEFLLKIQDYYMTLSKEIMPETFLKDLIIYITDNQYRFYEDCWKKYPKSKKRYSRFLIEDLETSTNYFSIIDFLEKQKIEKIKIEDYCRVLFKMEGKELKEIIGYKDWFDNK